MDCCSLGLHLNINNLNTSLIQLKVLYMDCCFVIIFIALVVRQLILPSRYPLFVQVRIIANFFFFCFYCRYFFFLILVSTFIFLFVRSIIRQRYCHRHCYIIVIALSSLSSSSSFFVFFHPLSLVQ